MAVTTIGHFFIFLVRFQVVFVVGFYCFVSSSSGHLLIPVISLAFPSGDSGLVVALSSAMHSWGDVLVFIDSCAIADGRAPGCEYRIRALVWGWAGGIFFAV